MNQAISNILEEWHMCTHMHMPWHIVIIIIIVNEAAKNSNITYSVKEDGFYTKYMLSLSVTSQKAKTHSWLLLKIFLKAKSVFFCMQGI